MMGSIRDTKKKHLSAAARLLPIMFFFLVPVLHSCNGNKGPKPDELASKAAEEYYGHLVAGRYEEYLSGMVGLDSIPESYREQLSVNTKQFMATQQKEHNGIKDFNVVRAVADSSGHRVDVFIMLCFGDSVKEEIVVPMIERDGRWMMR